MLCAVCPPFVLEALIGPLALLNLDNELLVHWIVIDVWDLWSTGQERSQEGSIVARRVTIVLPMRSDMFIPSSFEFFRILLAPPDLVCKSRCFIERARRVSSF